MNPALIVGCGYAGLRLGRRLAELGLEPVGTTRNPERAPVLEGAGIRPLVGDLGDRDTLLRIDRLGPGVVYYFVPPVTGGSDPLPRVLQATARAPLEAFIYASSTSVYGDRDGGWVDETTVPRPEGKGPEARLAAERTVFGAGWEHQTPTRICRITGIYGPGRTLKRVLADGEYVIIRDRDSWVNRIHVDDLVSGMIAAWRRGGDSRVYNLGDGEPHRASEFAALAADLHGLPRPALIEETEARARFGEDRLRRKLGSKRVRCRRLTDELEVELRYPSYRVGLPAAIEEERASAPDRR